MSKGNLLSFEIGSTRCDWTYDAMNRVLTEGQGAAVDLSLEYALGLLKKTTDASGRVAEHTVFDSLGRVKQTQVRQAGVLKSTSDSAYDTAGRLASVADSVSGGLSYTYDQRFDAVASETS
ncbi:MAG: hypothetical protein LH480_02545 [Rubrivivax sp.]|nr:hypothetical protein [Rubrivivax sp.]